MKALFISVALITVSVASVSAQQLPLPTVELTEPELVAERSPDYEARKVGAGILGFGLALAIPSATLAGLEASIAHRNHTLLATHAALAAVGASLVIGGIIRLVRTSRNALVDRRRLRRRLIPMVISAALSHALVTVVSVLPTVNLATGYSP